MTESDPFTIESFYRHLGESRLTAAACADCKLKLLPPRPLCPRCFSSNLEWIELGGRGTVEEFTVIHTAPREFRDQVPYVVAMVELEEGLRIPGVLRILEPEEVEIGMAVEVGFESPGSEGWPGWARYFFRPSDHVRSAKF